MQQEMHMHAARHAAQHSLWAALFANNLKNISSWQCAHAARVSGVQHTVISLLKGWPSELLIERLLHRG